MLTSHFLDKYNQKLSRKILRISPDTMETLMNYPWPGNVRELENTIERMITFCEHDTLKSSCIPDNIKNAARASQQQEEENRELIQQTYKSAKSDIVNSFTKDYLETLLKECGGKIKSASEISGMDRTCLYRLMKKHGISKDLVDD